jgi:hypothetical protein
MARCWTSKRRRGPKASISPAPGRGDPDHRIVIGRVPLPLQVEDARREHLDVLAEALLGRIPDVAQTWAGPADLGADFRKRLVIGASVYEPVARIGAHGRADELVSRGGESGMKHRVVRARDGPPDVDLARRTGRRRFHEAFRLLEQMLRIKDRHVRKDLAGARSSRSEISLPRPRRGVSGPQPACRRQRRR